jgi:hypothetical protein
MAMTVSKLAEGLRLFDADVKAFEDIDSNEQRAAKSRQGITRMFACCEEIMKEQMGGLCLARLQCFISSHYQGLVHRHLYY